MSSMQLLFDNVKELLLKTGEFEDNKSLDKYCQLICSNQSTLKVKYKTASHHVLPQFHYKYHPDDTKCELQVNLLHCDHALAHLYLYQCSVNAVYKHGNLASIQYILSTEYFPTDEIEFISKMPEYQVAKEEYIRLNSELQIGKQAGEANPFYGKHHTEATRQKMRENSRHLSGSDHPNYGNHLSDEAKRRIGEANSVNRQTPEVIAKRLKTMNDNNSWDKWKDPAYRLKLSNSRKQVWQNGVSKAQLAQTTKQRWQDPDYRLAHIHGMRNCAKAKCAYCHNLFRAGNLAKHEQACKLRHDQLSLVEGG